MAPRQLNGLVDAAPSASRTNNATSHTRLRHQILERGVDVAGPFLREDSCKLVLRKIFVRSSAALSVAAIIQREHVDSGSRQPPSQLIPILPLLIALVQQQH